MNKLKILLALLMFVACQNTQLLYHECGTTASSYTLSKWNIKDKNNQWALKETIDKQGRVRSLEFLYNTGGATLCYLPTKVLYEYPEGQIVETLYRGNDVAVANDCEMHYRKIYNLNEGYIVSTETFYKIDSITYPTNEVEETKKYVSSYEKYEVNDSINTEIEFYIFSFSKMNGIYPTNKNYKFPKGNYYFDKEPVNTEILKALKKEKTDNMR